MTKTSFFDDAFGDADDKAILLFLHFKSNQTGAFARTGNTITSVELVKRSVQMALEKGFVVIEKICVVQIESDVKVLTEILVGVVLTG